MPKEESKNRYKPWLKQAGFDLEAAKISLKNAYYEWATYQAEQAVEKALKAVIVHSGQRAPKVHKLSVLFGFSNSVNKEFRATKFGFRHLESFAFISRYPFLIPGKDKCPHGLIEKKDALKAIEQAEDTYTKIAMILESTGSKELVDELPKPISKEDLEERLSVVKDVLVREFSPEKIILFGSYARDPLPDKLSTMDILIIANTNLSFIQRIKKARNLTKGGLPTIEPLIYTPEEFKLMTEEEGESFFESALEEGREVFSVKS